MTNDLMTPLSVLSGGGLTREYYFYYWKSYENAVSSSLKRTFISKRYHGNSRIMRSRMYAKSKQTFKKIKRNRHPETQRGRTHITREDHESFLSLNYLPLFDITSKVIFRKAAYRIPRLP